MVPRIPFEITLKPSTGTEHQRLKKGQAGFLLEHTLPLQQRRELLGLQVGGDEWIVDCDRPSIRDPGPGAGVTCQSARTTLDLDEEEPLRRKGEQVDFIDAAVVGDELEVRPRPVWLMCWKPRAHELQSFPLPGVLRLGDRRPQFPSTHLSGRPCQIS